VKRGIVIIAELTGELADRVAEMQRRYDPRMVAELPPHITLTGSSGMGPISDGTTDEELRRALEPVASSTAPFEVRFGSPIQFMQSPVVVFPIDPHGPIRDLHEKIRQSGLRYEPARFTFTPHCTLSFYPDLPPAKLARALTERILEPVTVERIQVYRTETLTKTRKLLDLPLGAATA
jgi:2'-5' RNA ligase